MNEFFFKTINNEFPNNKLKKIFLNEFSEDIKHNTSTFKLICNDENEIKKYIDEKVRTALLNPENETLNYWAWRVILSYKYERRFNRILKKYLNNSSLNTTWDSRENDLRSKKENKNHKINISSQKNILSLSPEELEEERSEVLSNFLRKIYEETQDQKETKTNILNNFDPKRGRLITYLSNRLQGEIANKLRNIIKRIEKGEIFTTIKKSLKDIKTPFYDDTAKKLMNKFYEENECLKSIIEAMSNKFKPDSLNHKLFLFWKESNFDTNDTNIKRFKEQNPDISASENVKKLKDHIYGTIKTKITPQILKYFIYKHLKFTSNFNGLTCEKDFYKTQLYEWFYEIDQLCENFFNNVKLYGEKNCTKNCLYKRIRNKKLKNEVDTIKNDVQEMFNKITNNKAKKRTQKELKEIFHFLNLEG